MESNNRIENGICIVPLQGEFSQAAVVRFRKEMKLYLEDSTTKAIVVDMKEVIYLDSAALGAITFLHKQLMKRQKVLMLCHLSPKMNEVFQMAGLNKILSIYSTEEEAMKALK